MNILLSNINPLADCHWSAPNGQPGFKSSPSGAFTLVLPDTGGHRMWQSLNNGSCKTFKMVLIAFALLVGTFLPASEAAPTIVKTNPTDIAVGIATPGLLVTKVVAFIIPICDNYNDMNIYDMLVTKVVAIKSALLLRGFWNSLARRKPFVCC